MAKSNWSIEFVNINVDDESKCLPLNKVYPGIAASETAQQMRPHERESPHVAVTGARRQYA